jgi:hypothetical protein
MFSNCQGSGTRTFTRSLYQEKCEKDQTNSSQSEMKNIKKNDCRKLILERERERERERDTHTHTHTHTHIKTDQTFILNVLL